MPSQRLLKILGPDERARRVLASHGPNAIVWAGTSHRASVAAALAAAGVTPLVAASFRHVTSSLHPSARPHVSLAVLDFDVMTAHELSMLVSVRWAGYCGRLVALARSGVLDPQVQLLATVDAVLVPDAETVRAAVAGYVRSGRLTATGAAAAEPR